MEKVVSSEDVFEQGDVAVKITAVKKAPESFISCFTNNTWKISSFIIYPWLLSQAYLVHFPPPTYLLPTAILLLLSLFSMMSQNDEVKKAAKVTEWLSKGLSSVLPEKVQPDLLKLAISGHSRGGKIAFSLALGYETQLTPLKFQALIGSTPSQSIPVAVIGAGLSNQRAHGIFPPFAPNGVNHSEFFNESKPPCYYFLAKDYGHTDMLNDNMAALTSLVQKVEKDQRNC
ncbi:hypothetical protein HAX54_027609 [Datura stramonium]|uniref:Chlorophyllase n=1 Tax=Datura stramonium TaxID=4076 RepID=A0ABS8V501_DATST|nr:hypothetical protein [Datura stramonium]